MSVSQKYLTGPQVMERYSISEMTLYRWTANDEFDFPKPLKIKRRRFYDVEALDAWDRQQTTGEAA
jgi:predicted DNA-binding transcriptional regulator AlpA